MVQNFFRSYPKLAGMTGTAATEVAEFSNIYDLDVTIVPTNKARTEPYARCSAYCHAEPWTLRLAYQRRTT